MPRQFRLSREDMARFKGVRLDGVLFSVVFGVHTTRTKPGAACVVSKKVAASAVLRNRIRRRLRAALLPFLQNAPKPVVCVWYIKKAALEANHRTLTQGVESMWGRMQRELGRYA